MIGKTYIPRKHYSTFWAVRLSASRFKQEPLIEFTKAHLMPVILLETVRNKTIEVKR
jgi:hypothetical protein